jgi:WD40 repeat protein
MTPQTNVWDSLAGAEESIATGPRRKTAGKSSRVWLAAVGGGVLGVLAIVLVVVLLAGGGDSSSKKPEKQVSQNQLPPKDQKAADGKPRDGKPRDGNPRDGKARDGEPRDGKPRDGNRVVKHPLDKKRRDGGKPPEKTPRALAALDPSAIAAPDRHEPFKKELVAVFTGYPKEIFWIGFSPNGRYLAATGNDRKTVCLWDLTRAGANPTVKQVETRASNVSFSPDGTRLAFATETDLQVWDVPFKEEPVSKKPVRAMPYAPGSLDFPLVAYSPLGKTVAVSNNVGVYLVDVTGAKSKPTLLKKKENALVYPLAFSPDGATLVLPAGGKQFQLWDVKTGKARDLATGKSDCRSVSFAPDGLTLAGGCEDGTVHLWDLRGEEPKELWPKKGHKQKGHKQWANCVAFAPDGKSVVSTEGGFGNGPPLLAIWWDAATGEKIKKWDLPERCASCVFAGSHPYLAIGCFNSKVYVLHLAPKESPLDKLDPAQIAAADRHADLKELAAVLKGYPGEVWAVAISPNERYVAAAGNDRKTLCLWDLTQPGSPVRKDTKPTQKFPRVPLSNVVFSPDSTRVAVATEDRLLAWKVASFDDGKPVIDMEIKANPYQGFDRPGLAYSPDGKTIAVSTTTAVLLVDVSGEEPKADTLVNQKGYVPVVLFSPDGKKLVSAGKKRKVGIWDLNTRTVTDLPGPVEPWAVAFSPNGTYLAGACSDGTVHGWDLGGEEPKKLWGEKGHQQLASAVTFAPDGKSLVSTEGGFNNQGPFLAVRWNPATGKELQKWKLPERCATGTFAAVSPYLVMGCHDHNVYILDLRKEKAPEPVVEKVAPGQIGQATQGRIWSLDISPDGRRAVSGSGTLAELWDLENRKLIQRFDHRGVLRCVAFSAKGDRILTGGNQADIEEEGKPKRKGFVMRLWSVDSNQEIRHFEHQSNVMCVAFSPDGKRALSGSGNLIAKGGAKVTATDCLVRLWNLETGELIKKFPGNTRPVIRVQFSPDGRRAYSLGESWLRWGDVAKGKLEFTFPVAKMLTFTEDAHVLVGRGLNSAVNVKDRKTMRDVSIQVLNSDPKCLAVSRDNRHVLAGCGVGVRDNGKPRMKNGRQVYRDCVVPVIDLKEGKPLMTFEGHEQPVTSVAFAPDNRFALSGDEGGNIRIWDLSKTIPAVKKPDAPDPQEDPEKTKVTGKGLFIKGPISGLAQPKNYPLGKSFQIEKDWQLSLEYRVPDLAQQSHVILTWGEGDLSRNPLSLLQSGNDITIHIGDPKVPANWTAYSDELPRARVGKWITIRVLKNAGMMQMYLNGKPGRKHLLQKPPKSGTPRRICVGGHPKPNWQRHKGRIKNLRLENTTGSPK